MMPRSLLHALILIVATLLSGSATAQPTNPAYILRLGDDVTVPGETATVALRLSHPDTIQLAGWSYGVCHGGSPYGLRW